MTAEDPGYLVKGRSVRHAKQPGCGMCRKSEQVKLDIAGKISKGTVVCRRLEFEAKAELEINLSVLI